MSVSDKAPVASKPQRGWERPAGKKIGTIGELLQGGMGKLSPAPKGSVARRASPEAALAALLASMSFITSASGSIDFASPAPGAFLFASISFITSASGSTNFDSPASSGAAGAAASGAAEEGVDALVSAGGAASGPMNVGGA